MTKSKWNGLLLGEFKRPKKWKLEKELTFTTDLNTQEIKLFKDAHIDIEFIENILIVPKGYITDLASVPRVCWGFIAPFDVARPAVCHDILYEKINAKIIHLDKKSIDRLRTLADKIFLQGMNATEPLVASWKKYSAYYAVRAFGRFAIKTSFKRSW